MAPSTSSAAARNWEMAPPLLLQGAPYERGLAHGETLRSQIHEVVGRWKGELARMYQMDADEAIARFIGGTDFVPAIRRWTPDLLDEMRGIAAGADMAWEDAHRGERRSLCTREKFLFVTLPPLPAARERRGR